MTFFNKKEEVIDIELTAYGKYLLSKGKFSPQFYAFSDDEIVYDPAFNNSGSVEVGEQTFKRIVEQGVSTRALYDSESAEARVYQLNGHVIRTDKQSGRAIRSGKINQTPLDDIYGKDYADDISMQPSDRSIVRNILTTGKLGDKFVPSLSVRSLNDYAKFNQPIEMSASNESNLNPALRVPQLNIDINYRTFTHDFETEYTMEMLQTQTEYEKDIIFADNKRVMIDDKSVILEFAEENVDLGFDSGFDVEMFLVEERQETGDNGVELSKKEILRRLKPATAANQFDGDLLNAGTYVEIRTDTAIPQADLEKAARQNGDGVLKLPNPNTQIQTTPDSTPNGPRSVERVLDTIYNNFNPINPEEGDCE